MQDVELNDVKQERLQGGNLDSVLVFLFCLIVRFMFYFVLVFEDLLLVSLFDMVQKQGEKMAQKQKLENGQAELQSRLISNKKIS